LGERLIGKVRRSFNGGIEDEGNQKVNQSLQMSSFSLITKWSVYKTSKKTEKAATKRKT